MENNISPSLERWIKKCLKREFEFTIEKSLEEDEDYTDIAQRIIHSKEMSVLLNSMRNTIVEQSASRSASTLLSESRPRSSLSCISDQTSEDWNSPLINDEGYNVILDKISHDKPAHVRLAGYEILLKNELSHISNSSLWDSLQKALLDGLADESRPIFEASLQVHAKLLTCSQPQNVYANLLNAFDAQYQSQKTFEMLPTLIAGINFKFFLHERVYRIVHLIMCYNEEKLKCVRSADKSTEELIEQFMTFLASQEFGNAAQHKRLNILNIISVLEPRADWSKKWMISLATRRMFLAALGRSQSLLQHVMRYAQKGLEEPPRSITVSVYDDPMEVIVNGNTVETVTYLHCLCLVSQLCSYEAGQRLLGESAFDSPFSISGFLIASLKALNKLSSLSENNIKIWPHTLNIILHMLDTADGSLFLISECKEHTVNFDSRASKCPAMFIVAIASNMLKQPFSIINIEYLLKLFKVIEKLFDVFDVYEIVQHKIEMVFYPAVSYFYNKLDKSYFENEKKAQQINSAVNALLLKMVSVPFGLKALVQESSVFQELIEGSIAPLRMSWTSMEVVNLVTTATFFQLGYNVLANLAPHVLSSLLSETCKILEDPYYFHDPWDHENITNFLHILTFFSLNLKCFSAFMTSIKESYSNDVQNCPLNLHELFGESVDPESNYHYLGLLSLNTVIWNLNINIYLLELLDFQDVLLKLQNVDTDETENEEMGTEYVDDYTLLRHKIISKTYFVRCKDEEETSKSEEYELPQLPPAKLDKEAASVSENDYNTELENILQADKPGLLDSDWVGQVRVAYAASPEPLKNGILIQLVDQMQKAIPTAEWGQNFQWDENVSSRTDFWFAEEIQGINLALYYADQNNILENTIETREKLQEFINASYEFIQYERPKKFDGFDWFLSTVFIICEGDMAKCKTFITQLIQFPVTKFLWPSLGKVIDRNIKEECAIQFTFMQILESIVSNELPNIKFALKSTSGMDWSLICNLMVSQCFWGILPWSQIVHFLATCVLYSTDYIIYYCASLLHHCQHTLLRNVTCGKLWPEHIVLDDYECHNYFRYMDILDRRYGNKISPKLVVKGFDSIHEA